MRRVIIAAVSMFSAVLMACTVAPESSENPSADGEESVGETQQALANSGNLTGSICRACGCSWESVVKDGCTTWRCVCETTVGRDCVLKAPGSSATLSSDPPPPPPPPRFTTGTFTTAGAFAP